jgi:hypothetical protein
MTEIRNSRRLKVVLSPADMAFFSSLPTEENCVRFEVFTAGTLRRVALVRTDVSEKLSVSIVKVTRMNELGTLAVTISLILVTLIIEELIPPKRRFLQEPHGVASQKTPFFKSSFKSYIDMALFRLSFQ